MSPAPDGHWNKGRYSWTLCLQHPSVGAEGVERELGWAALLERVGWGCAAAGFSEAVDGGREELRWAGYVERGHFRYFFDHLCELIGHLERRREFLAGYLGTGGRGVFVLRLFGGVNIGDTLRARDVMRLGRLGVALRVEVAPVW